MPENPPKSESGRIERALRDSEARFRFMGDVAPVMLWMSGLDNQRTWFNARWLQFVGRPLDRELEAGWWDNVHPEDVGRSLETCTTAFEGHRPFTMEYRLKRHDGEYRWVLEDVIDKEEMKECTVVMKDEWVCDRGDQARVIA